jgi:hypothetical protein
MLVLLILVKLLTISDSTHHFFRNAYLTKGKPKLISIQTDKISQQPENCENHNDPDLAQAFLKKWWVESEIVNNFTKQFSGC